MKTKLEAGWYLNGGKAWYWNGREFTDQLDENAMQFSCVSRDMREEDVESLAQELKDATEQVGDLFVSLEGPYEFDEVCDGVKLLDPSED